MMRQELPPAACLGCVIAIPSFLVGAPALLISFAMSKALQGIQARLRAEKEPDPDLLWRLNALVFGSIATGVCVFQSCHGVTGPLTIVSLVGAACALPWLIAVGFIKLAGYAERATDNKWGAAIVSLLLAITVSLLKTLISLGLFDGTGS